MTNLQNITVGQLRTIVAIKEEIERLEEQVAAIVGGGDSPAKTGRRAKVGRPPKNGRRKMSRAARARIAAAQRRRWAKIKKEAAAPKAKRKRRVSAATRAKLAAVARARWARTKAAGKSTL